MKSHQIRRSFVILAIPIVLVAACARTTDGPGTPAAGAPVTMVAPPPPPEADIKAANAVAAKVEAKAKRSEKAEGKQDLVKDRVQVKAGTDGGAVVEQLGEASWYGKFHQGRKTASGTRFDQRELTAAHPTLPLGTEATRHQSRNRRIRRSHHHRSRTVRARPRHRSLEGRRATHRRDRGRDCGGADRRCRHTRARALGPGTANEVVALATNRDRRATAPRASRRRDRRRRTARASMPGSGTATTCMPAACAAATPAGASSTTRHDDGGAPSSAAASKKMSGAGLPRPTRGSSPSTTAEKTRNHSRWRAILSSKSLRPVLVATACGTARAASASVSSRAPGVGLALGKARSRASPRARAGTPPA